tara:strand:- start:2519 stop:5023 length:2505 start_codon:yes stop_codon:yes gene_type:complete
MAEVSDAQAGALEEPKDAGKGPQGIVKRWMMELDLSSKSEKNWRDQAKDVHARYRDEKADGVGASYSASSNRYSTGNRYNILYSNVQTICPALYNQTPKPDVRRRYRDADETGKVIADIMERGLSYTMDDYDFDRYMRLAVKDCQLTGRGVTRIKYEGILDQKENAEGDEYEEKVYDEVCWQHVNWADFRVGPGRTWEEVEWVAFKHILNKEELKEKFPETYEDVQMDYTPKGVEEDDDGDPIVDTFKRAVVWEIWCEESKEVIYIAPSLVERPLKVEDDPLGLVHFFPVPRPLYATENTDSLVPVEPFRFYKDQADELDELTKRISGIIKTCKVRGIYDSTVTEMSSLMDAGENVMVPATDVLPLMQAGGLEKAIWLWPVERIAGVLVHLYSQREAIKTTIYEITGIADIMRGSSSASETLGAQQLKAQFGTMRLDDMRREVQRFARDLVRMAAEVMAEHFAPDTMAIMTEVELPTNEQKQQAMMQAQQMQQQGQPLPKKFAEGMALPTWEEAMQVLRDDKQRAYRIDIETDSTVAGDQAADQKAITELLTAISGFIQNAGPAVAAGYLPLEAAKSLLMTSVRRFKMGREVEDALDMIGVEEEEGGEQPDPQMEQMHQEMQQAMQEMQQQVQQLSQENEQLKADKGADMQRLEMDGMKAQKAAEQKDREIGLKEFEAQKPQPDQTIKMQADMQMARERMQFEANEADKQRQVELAKAIIAKSDEENPVDEGGAMDQAAMMMQQVTAALTAPKLIVRDDMGNIIGSETSDVNTTMDTVSNVVAEQKGGVQNAMAALADAVSTQTRVLMSPKRVVNDENGRPIGMETVFDDDGQQ